MHPSPSPQYDVDLLQTVVTSVPVVLFALDADGNFVLSEGKGLTALGLEPGQVVGQSLFDVFASVPQILVEARRALKGEIVESITRVGDIVFEVMYTPLFDDNGQVTRVTGVAHDVTSLQNVREALQLKERAMQASSVGISIADMTHPHQPLIYVNEGFVNMTGYAANEVLGTNCRFLQGDDRDQEARHMLRNAINNGEEATVEMRNYRKDGTLFWNELKISPIKDAAGNVTHYVGFQLDVTQRKEYEARIERQNDLLTNANEALDRARVRAEEADRLKTDFLATMSHELRTPLNAIIGYSDIILAGMLGELDDDQRDYQTRIMKNAENLLSLINDLLDLSKIEAGRMELVHKPFNVKEWLDDLVIQIEGLATEKALDFRVALDERLPQAIMGDPNRLKQITINLLSNAIKFTNEGHIELSVRHRSSESWAIVVSDSGVGIPSHALETIFDEFRQVDGTSQREFKGTGLGLAIVRRLALRMGGNVRVKSKPGQGSSFTVMLPLRVPESEQPITQKA